MKYIIIWLVLTAILFLFGLAIKVSLPIYILALLSMALAALLTANEMKRPLPKEYLRNRYRYPKIPKQFLADEPNGVVFGKDYRTGKTVVSENGIHHALVCGSTGSGKSATMLIPGILTHKTGSAQICDIKSRELVYKTADVHDPKTIVIDMERKGDYIWGWDLLYKLKEDEITEQSALRVLKEVAVVIIPKPTSGDAFWSEAATNEFLGLCLFTICYQKHTEFVDIVKAIMSTPLRDYLELALNTAPKESLVTSYLNSLADCADETLFSIDITLRQSLFVFLSEEAVYFFKDNPHRANPSMLNTDGVKQYLCVSEEKLDAGFDKMMMLVMKQTLMELQGRKTSELYPETTLYWDEWQRLTESCDNLRLSTSSFLKTARSKNTRVLIVVQNIDAIKKELIYDIISNIRYFYVLSSNNANSLTSAIVTKMAGTYYEKAKSFSEGGSSSVSTSFQEKPVLKEDELNRLGDDAILVVSNYGYMRTNKQGTAYYKEEPYLSLYKARVKVNSEVMDGV